jgi:hypothetical protein
LFRLNKLLGDVVISQGGVVPFIQPELLPNATKSVHSRYSFLLGTDSPFPRRKGKKDDPSQDV